MQLSMMATSCRIVFAMQQYRSEAEWEVSRWERNHSQLSDEHRCACSLIQTGLAAKATCCTLPLPLLFHQWQFAPTDQPSVHLFFRLNRYWGIMLLQGSSTTSACQVCCCTQLRSQQPFVHQEPLGHVPGGRSSARAPVCCKFCCTRTCPAAQTCSPRRHGESQVKPLGSPVKYLASHYN